MNAIDWVILVGYLLVSILLGIFVSQRNRTEEDYFVAGRKLSGWLAGASMAATTFSIDTPLYVAGIIGSRGLSANWEWWSFGLAHVAMTIIFAPMWRRSGVLTDAAFTELRYGGEAAAWLRGMKAFLLSIPLNCIGIGYAFLAMRKVSEALGVVDGHFVFGFVTDTMILLLVIAVLILSYTVIGGLWGVVVNDFIQLALALLGAFAVAFVALREVGGMSQLLVGVKELNRPELLSIFPWTLDENGFTWIKGSGISVSTFFAFFSLQWWSFRRSDGGGEFIQRLLAVRDERQAALAGWVFLIINYLIRSWLWIIVGLAALVLLPAQSDWELGYPTLAVQYLPPIALGLVVVSLVAAFMSTVSTSVNWGASYVTHDLYKRFLRRSASSKELLLVGQLTSIFLLCLGIVTALLSDSIASVFRLVIAIGTGPGIILVLRWFWWRINAFTELAAMVSGFIIGTMTSLVPIFYIEDYGLRLIATTTFTAFICLMVLLFTPPESKEVLDKFVAIVRPPGPGWKSAREALDIYPMDSLTKLLGKFFCGIAFLFGSMLSIGSFLLHQERGGWFGLTASVIALLFLSKIKSDNNSNFHCALKDE